MNVRPVASAVLAVALLAWNGSALAQPSGRGPAPQAAPPPPKHVVGSITAIDSANKTITITPTNGNPAVVVGITPNTKLIGHKSITAAQIAVGDTLMVAGFPLTFQAGKITDNHLPPPSSDAASADSSSASADATPPPPPPITITGKVTSLNPPVIALDANHSVTLSTSSDTMYRALVPLQFPQLKVGQGADAQVMQGANGPVAVQVDVFPSAS